MVEKDSQILTKTPDTFYAHSLPGQPPEFWQPLEHHLRNVAMLAAQFAKSFDAERWGYAAGLYHDLGKYSLAFQKYLLESNDDYHSAEESGRIDHTSAGAQYVTQAIRILGHLLAYPIAGHHGGLLDAIAEGACLEKRLKKKLEPWEHGLGHLPPLSQLELPPFLREALGRRSIDHVEVAFTFSFFVRMLFSCLVDADFLDTEKFLDKRRAELRPSWPADVLVRMEEALEAYVRTLPSHGTGIDRERAEVRKACLKAAEQAPGLFSLTVPTGGGKTLSSLAFALRHATIHNLQRVIYVVPFTTIIEQNADVFRQVFQPLTASGLPDPVLEHHSVVDVGKETVESRLAAENWDAPLVVTTSVQFYESLFASRPSQCRKLHNLARAVIILDEAQKIPVQYLRACLLALSELTSHYGSTVVLCTATQPAIKYREGFAIGLQNAREITPDPSRLYLALKRVQVENLGDLPDDQLAERLLQHHQVLCIVNTRGHARQLFTRLADQPGTIHLSASMCPEHRSVVLTDVRQRLMQGKACRVIATQLVEAGVDLDFPVVFRSLAGLDSVAQAAGRCNRNGKLASGFTYLFRSEHGASEAFLRDTADATLQLLGGYSTAPLYSDLLSLEAVEHYFHLYYWSQKERWDEEGILNELHLANDEHLPFQFSFKKIAERFRIIKSFRKAVIIPWGKRGEELCMQLRRTYGPPDRGLLRELQRYSVEILQKAWFTHTARGDIELVHDRYPVLVSPELYYDEQLGLVLEREEFEAESFIA